MSSRSMLDTWSNGILLRLVGMLQQIRTMLKATSCIPLHFLPTNLQNLHPPMIKVRLFGPMEITGIFLFQCQNSLALPMMNINR